MFRFQLHASDRDLLLAASDEELIGRALRDGEVTIHISEQFYGREVADEVELRDLLSRCTVANLMGRRCVALAVELGLVRSQNVIELGDVPHAQIARMR